MLIITTVKVIVFNNIGRAILLDENLALWAIGWFAFETILILRNIFTKRKGKTTMFTRFIFWTVLFIGGFISTILLFVWGVHNFIVMGLAFYFMYFMIWLILLLMADKDNVQEQAISSP